MNYFSYFTKQDKINHCRVRQRDRVYKRYQDAVMVHDLSVECIQWRSALSAPGANSDAIQALAATARESKTGKMLDKASKEWNQFSASVLF